MEEIITTIINTLVSEIKDNMGIVIQITVIAFVCALVKGMEVDGMGKEISRSAFLVEYALIGVLLCTSIVSVKNIADTAIQQMVTTMNGVSPVLLTASAVFGNVTSAAGMGTSFIVATEIVGNVIRYFFLPAGIVLAVLSLVDNLSETISISNLVSFIKSGVLWGLGIIMTVYIAMLSIQSIVVSASETALNKTVKFAAGSMIPFVGQYLSESLDAVSASAVAINSATGTGAMLAIITMTIGPALKILIIAGLLKLTAAIIQPVADERITKCIGGTATAFSLISGLTAVCAAILTISIGGLLNTLTAAAGG